MGRGNSLFGAILGAVSTSLGCARSATVALAACATTAATVATTVGIATLLAAPGIATVAAAQDADARAADGIEARVNVEPRLGFVGDQPIYQITVLDADAPLVELELPPGVTAEALPPQRSRFTQVINGRRTDEIRTVLQWRLTMVGSGGWDIPPQVIRDGASTGRVPGVRIVLAPPDETTDSFLDMELEGDTVYVGQPIGMISTMRIGEQVSLPLRFSGPPSTPEVSISLDRTWASSLGGPEPVEISVGTETVNAQRGQWNNRGARDPAVRYRSWVVPQRAGTVTIPPNEVVFDAVTGTRGRGFRTENVTERRVARADPIDLEVRPLPTAGRPAGFSGMVGTFDLRVEADARAVNVGDAIELRAIVEGDYPPDAIAPPDLDGNEPFQDGFVVTGPGWRREAVGSRRAIFTATVRATTDGIPGIPPLELWSFDPDQEAYVVVRSDAIPLSIIDPIEVTAADAEIAWESDEGAATIGPTRQTLQPLPGSVRANRVGPDLLVSRGTLAAWTPPATVWWALVVPPVAMLVVVAGARGRAWRATGPPHARGMRAARRAMGGSGVRGLPPRAIGVRMVRAYIAERFGLERAAVTEYDVRRLFAGPGRDDTTIDTLAALVLPGDREITPMATPDGPAANAAVEVLSADPHAVLGALDRVGRGESASSDTSPASMSAPAPSSATASPPVSASASTSASASASTTTLALLVSAAMTASALLAASTVHAAPPTMPPGGSSPATGSPAGTIDADGDPPAAAAALLTRADAIFREALDLQADDPANAAVLFADAARTFAQAAATADVANPDLETNIGNAWLLAGDVAPAIRSYQRALRLDPLHRDARAGLRAARARVGTIIEPGVGTQMRDVVLAWRPYVSRTLLGAVALGAWGALCTVWTLRWLGHPGIAGLARSIAIAGAVPTGLLAIDAADLSLRTPGVVVQDTQPRHGPDRIAYEPLYDGDVAPGTEVTVLETRDGWTHLRFGDGQTGWIPESAVVPVVGQSPTAR